MEGKAREDPRRRREPAEDPVVPLITMDYQFYSRNGKEVDEEASLATVLNLTDRATAWTLSIPVAHKGHRHAAYAAGLVEQFVDRLVRQVRPAGRPGERHRLCGPCGPPPAGSCQGASS